MSAIMNNDLQGFLRNALRGNAAFSSVTGLLCIFDAGWLSEMMGFGASAAAVFILLGIGLLLFAASLFWDSRKSEINLNKAMLTVGMDVLWVVASAAILLLNLLPLSNAGWWTIAVVADIVAVFAVLQYLGVRRIRNAESTAAIA